MTTASVWAPILKSEEQDDGTLFVYGKATDDALDHDQQRCDPAWLAQAMPRWYATGANVRAQHDPKQAVGVGVGHDVAADGHYVKSHIVDPIAVSKVKAGVFKGYSIGISNPQITFDKASDASNGIVAGGDVIELSLCDRPSNPGCQIHLVKAAKPGMEVNSADFDAERGLVRCEELVEKADEPAELTTTVGESLTPEQVRKLEAIMNDATKAAAPEIQKDSPPEQAVVAVEPSADGCGCCEMCTCAPADMKAATVKKDKKKTKTVELASIEKVLQGLQQRVEQGDPRALELWNKVSERRARAFNKDAAKIFVTEVLEKADKPGATEDLGVTVPPVSPPEELGDIKGAKAAIAIIAQLIQSEAADMVCAPNEDLDIQCLLSAVAALRQFICREHGEPGPGLGASNVVLMAAEPELEKAKYSAEQLRQMLKDGKAMKNPQGDPSYPIGDKQDLQNAIHAVGRGSGDHNAIRAYIKRRASALGCSDMIPDNWTSGGSNKAADAEVDVTVDGKSLQAMTDEEVQALADEVALEKTTEPETTKAVVAEEAPATDPDALVKALTAALDKADNPLRQSFTAMIEAATEDTAKSVSALTERLSKVEAMATPGGPALRRTEVERNKARSNDLAIEAARFKAMASVAEDPDLRRGYTAKAVQLEAEIKALAA